MGKGGGGGESVRLDLPNWYVERLRGQVLPQIDELYAESRRNPLDPAQQEALAGMENLASNGSRIANQGVNTLSRLFENRGLAPVAQQLGQDLARGDAGGTPPLVRQVGQALSRGDFRNPAMGEARQLSEGSINPARPLALQLSGGFTNPAMGQAQQLSGGALNPAMAEANRIAMGGEIGRNPFLDAAYGKAADQVTQRFNDVLVPGMDRSFMESGRLGSGAYAKLRNTAEQQTGEALGDLATGIYGGAYEGDQSRRMGALGQLGQLGQADFGNRLAGTGLLGQLAQENFGNQLAGTNLLGQFAQQDTQNRLAGTGLLGQLGQQQIQNRVAGAGLLGQASQQQVQNQLAGAGLLDQGIARQLQGIGLGGTANQMRYDDLSRLYGIGQQRQNAPWDAASQYMGLLTATPGLGGGSQSMSATGGNPFGGAIMGGIGGAASGAAIGSTLAGAGAGAASGAASGAAAGSVVPGWGTAIGAGLGALAGLAGSSDRRVKEKIKRVGKTDAGTPIYTYKLKSGGPTQMGVMAQDLLKSPKKRDAVVTGGDGMYRVFYDMVK